MCDFLNVKTIIMAKTKNGIFLKLRGSSIEIENKKNPDKRLFKITLCGIFIAGYLINLIKSFGSTTTLNSGPMKYENPFVKSPLSKNIKWAAK